MAPITVGAPSGEPASSHRAGQTHPSWILSGVVHPASPPLLSAEPPPAHGKQQFDVPCPCAA